MVGSPDADHYFAERPGAPSRPSTVRLVLPDVTVDLATDRGVFSFGAVDTGTKLLLTEAASVPAGAVDLCDLGCGYGPIAVVLARRSPEAAVWAVDVNERARVLTAENATRNGVGDRVQVCASLDEVPAGVRFAGLWSNPPIRVGKAALHDLFRTWLPRVDGVSWLVVQKHLGADSLAAWLRESGWEVERVRSRLGYRILQLQSAG